MKKSILFIGLFFSFLAWGQTGSVLITGRVTNNLSPLSNVNIKIENSKEGITSDEDGNFEIFVNVGDVLTFTYVGMETVQRLIENENKVVDISMVQNIESLDEVTVTKWVRKTQEDLSIDYKINPNIIKSKFGYLDKDHSANYMYNVDGKNLNPSSVSILEAIRNKIPGLIIKNGNLNNGPIAQIIGVDGEVVFEVDGIVYKEVPIWLNINSVERIALVYGKVAAQKWGGGAGVLIINTKRIQNGAVEPGTDQPFDRAKLRNNIYKGDALSTGVLIKNEAQYVQDLYHCETEDDVKKVYSEYITNFGSLYSFVLDVVNTFLSRFENEKLAYEVLASHTELFAGKPIALKALAFIYQAKGKFLKANEIYSQLYIIAPDQIQSYFDLAISYREIGEYKKAANIFARYNYLMKEGLLKDLDNANVIMKRELNNLIAIDGNNLMIEKDAKKYILDDDFKGTRLVFEWNDSNAEFVIQFVNPEGRYFNSEQPILSDDTSVETQKKSDFLAEEHLIFGKLNGDWQINVKYLGNNSLTPSYLKATIYYNYAGKEQHKETMAFKLSQKNVNQQLFTVSHLANVVID